MNIDQLWDGTVITIPPEVAQSYINVLQSNGLYSEALGPRPNPAPVGGLTQQQTDTHYCHAFDGSLARIQFVYLDPKDVFVEHAELLRRFLSGGSVCLVDVPSGAGAAALVLLGTVAHLREQRQIPRLPLDIRLIWGEISVPAIEYAVAMLGEINPYLESNAIFVTYETVSWDVLDDVSNVELVQKIAVSKKSHPQVLLLVCNFSGFLERGGKWKSATAGLKLLLQFCSGDLNAGVWIEPDQKAVYQNLFQKIGSLFGKIPRFARLLGAKPEGVGANARYRSPLKSGETHRVNARALPIELAITRMKK